MSAPGLSPQEQAAQAAAAAAAEQFNVEAFTLLGVGLFITILRTYTRISTVGWRRLDVDDYLIWFAALCYAAETSLAYNVGHSAHGLANNGMTPEERIALSVDSPEYGLRILGSKIQLAGWTVYGTMLWALKASLLVFYTRLTAGMGRFYELRIYVGYGLVAISYLVVVLNLFLGCRPFRRNWQINPDPGDVCQPAVSGQVVWVYFSFNVITDVYLLSIPLPMLWKSSLRPLKKVGLMILFGGGILVIACATLRCVLIVTDPINGAQLAGSWAVRETFVAMVTTNLPMVYPLLTIIFGPCIGNFLSSMRSTHRNRDTGPSKSLPSYGDNTNHSTSKHPRSNPLTNVTFSESEERIVGVMELNDMKARSESGSSNTIDAVASSRGYNTDIQKDVEVNVVCQDRDGNELAMDQQRQQATASLEESMRRKQEGTYSFARGPAHGHPGDAV